MFKSVLSKYITTNMIERGWRLKDLARESSLSDSTINSYILQKSNNPVEDNVLMIIKAFGDPKDTLQRLRQEASSPSPKELKDENANQDDTKRIELFTGLLKSTVSQTLEEYRKQSAAQQTEIILHADQRVENERQELKNRTDEVVRQCNEEIIKVKTACQERISMTEAHCAQRVSDVKEHMQYVIAEREKAQNQTIRQYRSSLEYVDGIVHHLRIALVALVATNIIFGSYALFAYTTFDIHDTTAGLYRGNQSGQMLVLLAAVMLTCAAASMIISRRKKRKEEND